MAGLAEALANSAAQEQQYKDGFNYVQFLNDLKRIGRAL
jgi:hypothetical protein